MTGQNKSTVDEQLAASFKELAVSKSIEKITIKEITDKAGVIRPTFYNHFQDKYELLEWIIRQELIEPIRILIQNGLIREAEIILFSNIEKEKDFYQSAVKLEGQNSFESIARQLVEELLYEIVKERTAGKKHKFVWLTPEHIAEYYAQSMCYVVITWIKTGMTISAKEMAEIYAYIEKRSMEDVLSEM